MSIHETKIESYDSSEVQTSELPIVSEPGSDIMDFSSKPKSSDEMAKKLHQQFSSLHSKFAKAREAGDLAAAKVAEDNIAKFYAQLSNRFSMPVSSKQDFDNILNEVLLHDSRVATAMGDINAKTSISNRKFNSKEEDMGLGDRTLNDFTSSSDEDRLMGKLLKGQKTLLGFTYQHDNAVDLLPEELKTRKLNYLYNRGLTEDMLQRNNHDLSMCAEELGIDLGKVDFSECAEKRNVGESKSTDTEDVTSGSDKS